MNKLLSLFAVLLLGAILLPACSKDDGKKPLIVACEVSTSPYCYYSRHQDNPVAGVDIEPYPDLGRGKARAAGLPEPNWSAFATPAPSVVERWRARLPVPR